MRTFLLVLAVVAAFAVPAAAQEWEPFSYMDGENRQSAIVIAVTRGRESGGVVAITCDRGGEAVALRAGYAPQSPQAQVLYRFDDHPLASAVGSVSHDGTVVLLGNGEISAFLEGFAGASVLVFRVGRSPWQSVSLRGARAGLEPFSARCLELRGLR